MHINSSNIPKALLLNCLVGAGYYAFHAYNGGLSKKLIRPQLEMHAFSSIVYTIIQSQWDSPRKLNGFDILPIAFILMRKVQEISWKTHTLNSAILAGSEIAIVKALTKSSPSSDPKTPEAPKSPKSSNEILSSKSKLDTQWLQTSDIQFYYSKIEKNLEKSRSVELMSPYVGDMDKMWEEFVTGDIIWDESKDDFVKKGIDKQIYFLPLHISGNHWTLIYINLDKRVVNYYDSMKNYGNFEKIEATLKDMSNKLTEKFPDNSPFKFESKINKSIQQDSFQCGVWVLYFTEQLLKDSDVDFNQLETNSAQKLIAQFRKNAIPHFPSADWQE